MTLKHIFIYNLKEFRKKEGFSQMKLAEFCDTAPSYIGQIETGRKFPSMEMIEKMATVLRIEPYLLFKKPQENNISQDIENLFPLLPNSMKKQIKTQIEIQVEQAINKILNEIFNKY